MTELGSNRDRHANLGEGEIGADGIAAFLSEPRFDGLPVIFEGPGASGKAVERGRHRERARAARARAGGAAADRQATAGSGSRRGQHGLGRRPGDDRVAEQGPQLGLQRAPLRAAIRKSPPKRSRRRPARVCISSTKSSLPG